MRFVGWTGSVSSDSPATAIVANGPTSITGMWKHQYLLTVKSEFGFVNGTGWYDEGSTARISVVPSSISSFPLLVQQVFYRWDSPSVSSATSSVTDVVVTGPSVITAEWATSYQETALILGVIAVFALLGSMIIIRKRRKLEALRNGMTRRLP
ncbi:MAG: hypothetical protein ABSF82_13715 [Candidatus Bathyarchaeia archaeon]|jgi:hypothetical protein